MSREYTSDWVSHNVAVWGTFLKKFKGEPVVALELGSHEGRSAVWFAENILTHPEAAIQCVDMWPYPEVLARFKKNIEGLRIGGHHAPTSQLVFLPEKFAFIYIDADHQTHNVLLDACRAWGSLVPGGVMILDDYQWRELPNPPGPAIDAFLECMKGQYKLLHKANQVIIEKNQPRPGDADLRAATPALKASVKPPAKKVTKKKVKSAK